MPNIHHAVLIAAPPEKVYDAITSRDGLAAWWTPGASGTSEKDAVLRFAFGNGYFKEMKVVALKPPRHVEWLCTAGADEWIDTTLAFTIEPLTPETIKDFPEMAGQLEQSHNGQAGICLTFYHGNWQEYTPMYAECNYTWGQFLRSLKLYCETGQGRPWPEQHKMDTTK